MQIEWVSDTADFWQFIPPVASSCGSMTKDDSFAVAQLDGVA